MILSYNKILVDKMGVVLKEVGDKYESFLYFNNNVDDIDLLCKFLQERSNGFLDVVDWEVDWHEPDGDSHEWFFASTEIVNGNDHVTFVLKGKNLERFWENEIFEYEVLGCFCHETIHLAQFAKCVDKLDNFKSGFQKGVDEWERTGNENRLWEEYYSDPFEIMAFGHNLYLETINSSEPEEVLREPENFLDELPTYLTYRRVFEKGNKIIKRLLRYAYEYKEASEFDYAII